MSSLYDFVDELLTAHKNAGSLGINWLLFGSNNHEKRPEGGVLKNFTMCAEHNFPDNHIIKMIIDPAKIAVVGVHSPELCYYGYCNINEDGEMIGINTNQSKEVRFEKIRINHYYCKSMEEFLVKKDIRGDVNNFAITMQAFTSRNQNAVHDTEILSHI